MFRVLPFKIEYRAGQVTDYLNQTPEMTFDIITVDSDLDASTAVFGPIRNKKERTQWKSGTLDWLEVPLNVSTVEPR